ncbi:MAG: redox-sensing transcriptional repressor Rex [Anaerolineales bacterium]
MVKLPPPDIVIGRLPMYLRALHAMSQEGIEVAASYELGQRLGISSAQIRKDLALFGDFGKQGTGYQISYLIEQLRTILQVNRNWAVIVVGAGHVGLALINYGGFQAHGFHIEAIFDADPAKIGQSINGYTIQDVEGVQAYIQAHDIKFAMVATPAGAAQAITDTLVEAGIQCILNYAPTSLAVPEGVYVQDIDPVSKLQHMAYYVRDGA